MRTADLTTALALMAIRALVVWDALRLGIGWGTDGPRSGFFPFWLAVIVGRLLRAYRGQGGPSRARGALHQAGADPHPSSRRWCRPWPSSC